MPSPRPHRQAVAAATTACPPIAQGRGLGCFHDIGALTMFADYRVPVVLRQMGVLTYSQDLATKAGATAVPSSPCLPCPHAGCNSLPESSAVALSVLHLQPVGAKGDCRSACQKLQDIKVTIVIKVCQDAPRWMAERSWRPAARRRWRSVAAASPPWKRCGARSHKGVCQWWTPHTDGHAVRPCTQWCHAEDTVP